MHLVSKAGSVISGKSPSSALNMVFIIEGDSSAIWCSLSATAVCIKCLLRLKEDDGFTAGTGFTDEMCMIIVFRYIAQP